MSNTKQLTKNDRFPARLRTTSGRVLVGPLALTDVVGALQTWEGITMTETEKDWVTPIGQPALESIKEMVAALECDYERLEELREERDNYEPTDGEERLEQTECKTLSEQWAFDNPDDAEELKQLEEDAGECESREDAEQRINEDPLSLQFRSGWSSSSTEFEAEEYELLLGTGGPAVRIVGEINNGEAHSARLEVQDWFKPWTEYIATGDDNAALLTYARQFYMGS